MALFRMKPWYNCKKELKYKGLATPISLARENIAATAVGNYALFAGGNVFGYSPVNKNIVDVYNTSLTKSLATALTTPRTQMCAETIGDYALFAGGLYEQGGGTYPVNEVETYNSSLTKSRITDLTEACRELASAAISNYVIFAGGKTTGGNSGYTTYVEAYNASLTKMSAQSLNDKKGSMGSASADNYAIFAGGYGIDIWGSRYQFFDTVDAYDTSLVRTALTALSTASYCRGGVAGDYYLFCINNTYTDVYNASLTKSFATPLTYSRSYNVSIDKYMLCAGQTTPPSSAPYVAEDFAEIYDDSLTKSPIIGLSVARDEVAVTSLNNYAIYAGGSHYKYNPGGGEPGSGYALVDTVDVFQVS